MKDKLLIKRRGHTYLLARTVVYFAAFGYTSSGRLLKRDGQIVTCGHKHKTEAAADRCARRLARGNDRDFMYCQASEVRSSHYTRATYASS